MEYSRVYEALIEHAQNHPSDGYTEKHHIIPRCLGGSNDPQNIVRLTARQHFIAHLLLAKIYGGKLAHAAFRMSNMRRYGNRQHAWMREKNAAFLGPIATERFKGKGLTEAHKKAIKKAMASPSVRQAISAKRAGVLLSENHKAAISKGLTGKRRSPYKTNANRGRKRDPDVMKRMAETRKRNGSYVHTAEQDAKFSAAMRGRTKSPEHRAKLAEILKNARAKQRQMREAA